MFLEKVCMGWCWVHNILIQVDNIWRKEEVICHHWIWTHMLLLSWLTTHSMMLEWMWRWFLIKTIPLSRPFLPRCPHKPTTIPNLPRLSHLTLIPCGISSTLITNLCLIKRQFLIFLFQLHFQCLNIFIKLNTLFYSLATQHFHILIGRWTLLSNSALFLLHIAQDVFELECLLLFVELFTL